MIKQEKFEFNLGFQWDIIKYTIIDRKGYRALLLYKYSYFDLLDQQVIVRAIQKYFDRRGSIPSKASVLLEQIKALYKSRDYVNTLKEKDRDRIDKKIKVLYKGGISDGEEILEKITLFASYVDVKNLMSKFDITNYDDYEKVAIKLQQAVNKQKEVEGKRGSFIVGGVKGRVARRKFQDTVIPTPFYQLNRTTNAGGLPAGSLIVLMDKEKGGKTLSLINVARGYLKKRRKVCFLDLENGQESIEDRVDQSVGSYLKKELLYKDTEQSLKKLYRKYRRIGAELYVERLPAGSSFNDIDRLFNRLKEDVGFIPNILIVDYFLLMSSTTDRARDDLNISQIYIDAKNFANNWGLDAVWTANHISRDAYKRRSTKYQSGDAARALDIGRNADLIMGVNQTQDEEEANVLRWEVVDQRDGRKGTVVFSVDHGRQRLDELTKDQLDNYLKYKASLGDDSDSIPKNDLDEVK